MGLLLAAVSGGAKGYNDYLDSEIKKKNDLSIAEQRMQMEEQMKARMQDRAEAKARDTAQAIDKRTNELVAGEYANRVNEKMGSNATGEDAAGLIGNAQARKAYGIDDISEVDKLKLRAQAAGELGALDQQKEINSERHVVQDGIKSDRQFEATMARYDRQDERAAQTLRQANQHNSDANARAQSAAFKAQADALTPEYNAALKALKEAEINGDTKAAADAQDEIRTIREQRTSYLNMALGAVGAKVTEDNPHAKGWQDYFNGGDTSGKQGSPAPAPSKQPERPKVSAPPAASDYVARNKYGQIDFAETKANVIRKYGNDPATKARLFAEIDALRKP